MTESTPAAAAGIAKPDGRRRWLIIALLFVATTVNYVDRTMLGLLAPSLGKEMGWSENDYGTIVTAFQAAYAMGFLIMGWLIDRFGPKIGYAIAITVWTVGHVAHGFASTVGGFMAARVVLGVGEAGHFPAVARSSSEWFPQKERALAIGWVNSGTNIGVIVTAPVLALFMNHLGLGWRETFIWSGLFGVALLLLWWKLYSNPRESGKVSEAELAWIEHDPPEKVEQVAWRRLMGVVYRQGVGAASRHLGVAGYRQKVVLHQVAVVCSDLAAELQQNLLLKQPRMPKLVLTIS